MADDFAFVCGSLGFFGILFGFFALMRYLAYRETVALAEKGLVRGQIRGDNRGTLRWGISLAAIGMALCLGLWPIGFIAFRNEVPLGLNPWMLFGLLPLFFGLGLVLFYYLSAAEEKKGDTKPTANGAADTPQE
jgi:hypothetical protein